MWNGRPVFGPVVAAFDFDGTRREKMAGKNTAVFGIFQTREAAEEAVDALRKANFRNTDISALFPDNAGTKDFAHEKSTKAPEGASTGAASGVVAGGVLGWLAGIGALAIPGFGPFIAAGPIMAALAGAGALGAVGGIVGGLVGMGIPEYEAKRYEGRVRHGGILLSVHCDSTAWTKRAEEILKMCGAEDIASSAEAAADFAKTDKPMVRSRSSIVEESAEEHARIARQRALVDDALVDERAERDTVADRVESPRTRTVGGTTRLDS
jgi:hypothetical protein